MENMDITHGKTSGKTININRLKLTQHLALGKEPRKVGMLIIGYYCCYSVTQSCLTLYNPMDCSTSGLPGPHHLLEFAQVHVHCFGDTIQPSHPLSSPSPSAFNLSQHQAFSNESAVPIRWPNYWSPSFSISPSNEYSRLISFKTDWFDLLAPQFKSINSLVLCFLYGPALTTLRGHWADHSLDYTDLCQQNNVSAFHTV